MNTEKGTSNNQRENITSQSVCKDIVSICVKSEDLFESLRRTLEDNYEIERVQDGKINGHVVDIHIVDEKSFEDNKDHLSELKELISPEILPVMVISENRKQLNESPDIWKIVDDIIEIPLHCQHITSRVELLLGYRQMSKELTRREAQVQSHKRKLEDEKDFLYYVADRLPGVLYMLNQDLEFVYWNHNYVKNLGYSEVEIRELSPYDLFDEKGKEVIKSAIDHVYEVGDVEVTVPIITKEGSKRDYLINGSKIDKDGESYIVGSGIDITDRVKAQQDYLQQKKLMEAIIDQSHSLIYAKDQDGRYKVVNKAFLDTFGLEADDVIGKTQKDIFGDNYIKRSDCEEHSTLTPDQGAEYEEEVEINGQIKCFQTSKYPLRGVPGFEHSICEISTDITPRKNLQVILEERNKEKNCLLNISNDLDNISEPDLVLSAAVDLIGSAFPDPEDTYVSIIYGEAEIYSNGNLPGGTPLESKVVSISEKQLQIKAVIDEAIASEKGQTFLDEKIDLLNRIVKIVATKLGRLDDLRKLYESEKRWENLVKNDPDLVMIVEDDVINFINDAGAKMYGSQPEDLVGKNLFQLITIEEPEKARERLQAVSNGEEVEPYIHKITHAVTGESKFLRIQSVPIPYNQKKAIQIVCTDMTSRIESENQLKDIVIEKNVLLQEVHHRVKNNLAVVSGLLELQLMESTDEKLVEALSDSVSRIKTMALVHEKLYSQDSLSDVNFEEYLTDLTNDILNTFKDNNNVQLSLNIEPLILNVNQAVPCAMILNELVTNSFKHAFSDQQDGEVCVSIREEAGRIYAAVQDNGTGLKEDFLKINNSMGVTIINTLIDQLGANVKAENKNGASISFDFKFGKLKGVHSNLIN